MNLYWFAFGNRKEGERKAPEDERRGKKKQSQPWLFGKAFLGIVHRLGTGGPWFREQASLVLPFIKV